MKKYKYDVHMSEEYNQLSEKIWDIMWDIENKSSKKNEMIYIFGVAILITILYLILKCFNLANSIIALILLATFTLLMWLLIKFVAVPNNEIEKEDRKKVKNKILQEYEKYTVEYFNMIVYEIDYNWGDKKDYSDKLLSGIWEIILATIIALVASKQETKLDDMILWAIFLISLRLLFDSAIGDIIKNGFSKKSLNYKRNQVKRFSQDLIYAKLNSHKIVNTVKEIYSNSEEDITYSIETKGVKILWGLVEVFYRLNGKEK